MTRFSSAARLITIATVLAVSAGKMQAQITKPLSWTVSAGLSVPNGAFGDFYDSGYHLAGGLNYQQHPSPIGFRVEAMFNQFKLTGTDPGENANVLSVSGNIVITSPTSVVGPYLIGGIGIYDRSEPGGFSDTSLGVNIGAGFRFSLGGLDAFGEARWHQDGDANTRFIPISFGVIF